MEQTNTDRACVLVFAKISASISHEIKNTLSIINENAGLLEDFAQMAEEDGGVAVERVYAVTKTIAKQVDRANLIMKNLNRFAHSADTSLAHGSLDELLQLVVALTGRQADMKKLTTTLTCPPGVALTTYLIFLESLVYLTLLTLFKTAEENSEIAIEAINEGTTINMSFTLHDNADLSVISYPDIEQKLLAEQLGASWKCDKNRLFLSFPAVIG
jgi:nitrogen fixation/metabolism regulation signal transduction histidine kinase